jgi:uncharacterized protein YaaQ
MDSLAGGKMMSPNTDDFSGIDQLVMVIVASAQAGALMDKLSQKKFSFTKVDSSGGFLHEATLCLLVGLNHERRPALIDIIQQHCHRRKVYIPAHMDVTQIQGQPLMIEAEIGGATMFTLNVERFEQL